MLRKIKNTYHLSKAILANLIHLFPSRKLFVIGVTGTNGKTTTVQMIANILEKAGHKVGVNSTINYWIGPRKWTNESKFTTTNPFSLQQFLAECKKEKCDFVVLEVSSHALDQHRVFGVDFDLGVITNVTREHLDYHKTMEHYRKTKLKLFKKLAKKKKPETGCSIVNLNMKEPEEYLIGDADKTFGYNIKKAKKTELKSKNLYSALKIRKLKKGSSFEVKKTRYSIQLPGRFNIENALASITVAKILKIKEDDIKKGLRSLKKVPGRMEEVENSLGVDIIIDYALTPDSMKKVGNLFYQKVKKRTNKKLIWVFGSCGERDRGKRPIMGRLASKYADIIIVTNEDPYRENPRQIINEIFQGVNKSQLKKAYKILHRRKAIKKALHISKKGDILLVTGKGAEQNMMIGKKLIKWNDREVIEDLINEYYS